MEGFMNEKITIRRLTVMHHSQSYPVTVQVNLPQPHVSYVTKSSNNMLCSGWCPFVTAGAVAVVFLVCIHVFGGQVLFPKAIDTTGNLVPTVKKGSLRIYPYLSGYEDGVQSHYFTSLPPNNVSGVANSLKELLTRYPEKHEKIYKNCWLENPSPENPCFFDSSWVKEVCTSDHSYGYEEKDGYYSPCFIMRLEKTEDWIPGVVQSVPDAMMDNYDQGFIPVLCVAKTSKSEDSPPLITVYPPKGFSHLFFPVNGFNQERYLLPMVAVKLNRIRKSKNITVECSVDAPNAFFLWNNGRAVIRFETI